MADEKLMAEVEAEIANSLLLDEGEKDYWRRYIKRLPENAVRYFFDNLKDKDEMVEDYLEKAIDEDPSAEAKLKEKVLRMRKEIMNIDGGAKELKTLMKEELKKI